MTSNIDLSKTIKKEITERLYRARDLFDVCRFFESLLPLDEDTQKEIIYDNIIQIRKLCDLKPYFSFSYIELTELPSRANFAFLNFLEEEGISIYELVVFCDENTTKVIMPCHVNNVIQIKINFLRNETTLQGIAQSFLNLQVFQLENSFSVKNLCFFPQDVPHLKSLKIEGNSALSSLKGLPPELLELREILIYSNNRLKSLKGFPQNVPDLNRLEISCNDSLSTLKGLPSSLPNLFSLKIINNNKLFSLKGLSTNLPKLRELFIVNNDSLTSLEGLPSVFSLLYNVYIANNSSLKSFDYTIFKNVKNIYIHNNSFSPSFKKELSDFCKKNNIKKN
ncbi:MAG: hypothetical protein ACTSP3_02430 [Candidatus Heimdallarchaeaceae archaeon]